MHVIRLASVALFSVGCASGYAGAPPSFPMEEAEGQRLEREQNLSAAAARDAMDMTLAPSRPGATRPPRALSEQDAEPEPVADAGYELSDGIRYAETESVAVVASSRRRRGRASTPPPAPPPPPSAEDQLRANAGSDVRLAQNATGGAQATDAVDTSGPLLVYTAALGLAAYDVEDKLDRVELLARERGGFLASRTNDRVIVRVPARQFQAALAAIQELGDVITRQVDVADVGEEFRDTQTRIETLERMRSRLEELLADADDVEDALAVEQQLERIVLQLETLKGRLRYLSDRVAYSTISVRFAERAPQSEPAFELPFPWLRELGLDTLMRL